MFFEIAKSDLCLFLEWRYRWPDGEHFQIIKKLGNCAFSACLWANQDIQSCNGSMKILDWPKILDSQR